MKKKITTVVLLLLTLVMLVPTVAASASEPFQTYTYSIDGYALYSPAAYAPVMTVDSNYMGLLENGGVAFDEPGDIFADNDGRGFARKHPEKAPVVLTSI